MQNFDLLLRQIGCGPPLVETAGLYSEPTSRAIRDAPCRGSTALPGVPRVANTSPASRARHSGDTFANEPKS